MGRVLSLLVRRVCKVTFTAVPEMRSADDLRQMLLNAFATEVDAIAGASF